MKLFSDTNINYIIKFTLLCIVSVTVVIYQEEVIAVQIENNTIHINNKHMSINSDGSSLSELLKYLQKKTQIDFVIQEQLLNLKIYAQFISLPIEEALKKLFKGKNVSFIFDSQNGIEKVVVFDDRIPEKEIVVLISQFPEPQQQDDADISGPYPDMSKVGETMITEPAPEADTLEEAMNITSFPRTADAVMAMRALGVEPLPNSSNKRGHF